MYLCLCCKNLNVVNEPSVQGGGHELLNRFEFHYEPSRSWIEIFTEQRGITFPLEKCIWNNKSSRYSWSSAQKVQSNHVFCEGNQEENCSWAAFFLNRFQKYIFHSLYDIPRVRVRVDSRSQEENFIPPQIVYIYIYNSSLPKLPEYSLYSLRAGKLHAPLSTLHSQRSTLRETLPPGDTLTAFKNVFNADPVLSTAPFFQILARIRNWNSHSEPSTFFFLRLWKKAMIDAIRSKAVKVDYPENLGIEKERKKKGGNNEQSVFICISNLPRVPDSLDRGKKNRATNRLENNGSGTPILRHLVESPLLLRDSSSGWPTSRNSINYWPVIIELLLDRYCFGDRPSLD